MRFAKTLLGAAGALALLCVQALAAPPVSPVTPVARLAERDYGPLAVRLESKLRAQVDKPMLVEFHRRQAFRVIAGGDVPLQVLSIAWTPEAGGDTHCVLGAVQGTQVYAWDALSGETEAPPWSCDGEPALRFTDLDADGCADVVALYPMRPPSGERFLWPLVLRCAQGGAALEFDAERSRVLRTGAPPKNLAQALLRLSKVPQRPGP
jgi:hypothetical protein